MAWICWLARRSAELVRDEVYLRSVGRVQVKGKTKPVDVFTFVAARGEETDPEFLKWLETYEGGVGEISRTRFYRRENSFFTFPGILSRRSAGQECICSALSKYEQAPPDETWEAIEVFKKK
jgi:hypothetical protein